MGLECVNHSQLRYTCFRQNTTINSVDLRNTPWMNDTVYNGMSMAFENCTNLKAVYNINNSVANMAWAFTGCTSLMTAPILPTNVKTLYETFYGCNKIEDAPTIPNGVMDISITTDA